jgi:uncharacterized protein (DUF4415 family)
MTRLRKLRPFTEADEAEVQRQIASNPDAPEATDEQLAHPMTFAEAIRRQAGRPRLPSPKQQVSVRLDADVLEKLRASGPGWQARMNAALRKDLGLKAAKG